MVKQHVATTNPTILAHRFVAEVVRSQNVVVRLLAAVQERIIQKPSFAVIEESIRDVPVKQHVAPTNPTILKHRCVAELVRSQNVVVRLLVVVKEHIIQVPTFAVV